jgi:hypothetical protein
MFGQKSREREMYISEHVAYIRHRPTTVGCEYIYKLSLVSTFLFFFFFRQWRGAREYIENNAQRVNRRANSSVGSFVSLFLTFIVVYCRQKFIVLCLIFVDHILIYIKKTNKKINLVNFTNIYTYSKKKIQIKYWIIAWWAALSLFFPVCMLCFVMFIVAVVVVDKREEKSSPIHMIVLFSLCGFCKFMTRSHTHPNWEHLHLILKKYFL